MNRSPASCQDAQLKLRDYTKPNVGAGLPPANACGVANGGKVRPTTILGAPKGTQLHFLVLYVVAGLHRLTENAKIYSSNKVEKINFGLNTVVLDSPKPALSEEILRLRLRMTESEGTELRVTRTIKILILGQPVQTCEKS